ncbi:type IV secretory system conjugative DNA transfer family protein [Pseudomonas sp. JG-B]|uniref:type IV secretory system conjugative DNA transfer family protein n=1 Tax=Pseudomonas sp. JG-B TaxID=2603214 RepID=UPI0015B3A024|nr:type IV secretory system conjugative DNA transfer family protein [Pseudomonas sp. JG-B]
MNTRKLPQQDKSLKYQCLLLMDEFTAMGKIQILSKGISYIAGYGLRVMPIIQSPAQLVEVYGKDAAQTFTTNHALQIVFPPKPSELQTAKDISEWLGYQTVKGISESRKKNPFDKSSGSETHSDQRRALLLPQEITGLPQTEELVVAEGIPPILAQKIKYYQDPVFVERMKIISPSLRALGDATPTQQQLEDAFVSGELGASVPLIERNSTFRPGGKPAQRDNEHSRHRRHFGQPDHYPARSAAGRYPDARHTQLRKFRGRFFQCEKARLRGN